MPDKKSSKYLLYKIVLLCFCSAGIQTCLAQFTWSNPRPSGYLNSKVVFTNASNGYIINANGDLLKTSDTGNTWNFYRKFPSWSTLDARDSFLVIGGADTTVYISTDMAQTWKAGIIRQKYVVEKLQIINKDTVFALCKNQSIGITELYQSVNGGVSWQLVNSSFIIKGIDFVNSKLGYATSFGGIFKTLDGGISWQNVYNSTSGILTTIEFNDNNDGYAYGDNGILYKTIDGGSSWTVALSGVNFMIYTIFFANASTIYLAGQYGVIYRSSDNGNSWQVKANNLGYADHLYSMYFISPGTGVVVGQRGQIFKTINGGDTYVDYAPTYTDIKPISFPTPSTGYAASWTEVLKTTDTGKTWIKLPFSLANPVYNRFQYLSFFSKDTGIAIAHSPVRVFKTYNGGQNWAPITLPILYKDYINGFFTQGNSVYVNISGAYGNTMLRSKDRAGNWEVLSQDAPACGSLFFVDEKTGYGKAGSSIYKTTDSARSWSRIFINDYHAINSIWFTDPSTGYAFGDNGYNQMTTDSGRTWTRINIASDNINFPDVYAVKFFTKKIGYLTCGSGGIYRTFDGGKNWRSEKSSPSDCKTIEMSSDTTIYLTGEYGTILKKDMREYMIDSLKITVDSSCSVRASGWVTAVLSQVDSIWFEYGTSGFSKSIEATPRQVRDSSVKSQATLRNLVSDSNYSVRVKILYRNSYYYSEPITFKATGAIAKPVITPNGPLLTSSASSGNQWYLNAVLIPGATSVSWQAFTQGTYSVQQTLNSCLSPMSEDYRFITTGINDPVLTRSVSIYPNPVTTTLKIKNNDSRYLHIVLSDSKGSIITNMQTRKTDTEIDLRSAAAGIYTILVKDLIRNKMISFKLMKL